jgi:hypothetical protein
MAKLRRRKGRGLGAVEPRKLGVEVLCNVHMENQA